MKQFLLLLASFIALQTANAQTAYTWNGSISTSWNTAGNWTPNGIPGAADNITVVTGGHTCTLIAGEAITNISLTSGTLDLGGFTLQVNGTTATFMAGTVQNGNLTVSGAATTTFGNGPVTMNCNVNITSAAITLKNTTFQGTTNLTKTGASNDASGGNNIFNGVFTATNAGSGYLMFGNGNPDQFNTTSTFNNTGSSNLYVAYNSSGNIFGGVTTFNNTPTANTGISVSQNSAGTIFNNNIVITSTNGGGVQFCGGGTATSTLSAGNTISIGAGGFSAGTLYLRQFTQTGATAQSLTLTGTANLTLGPVSSFGGNLTAASPAFFLNGTTFNGTTNLTKTGTTGDWNAGGNTFNGVCSITNSGSSFWLLGNSSPDIWNSDVTFTDNGSERLLPCWASTGNQFNGNIYVNTSGSAQGIQFCGGNTTATATLAATKTIQPGGTGLTAGYLYLKQFTELGSAPVTLTATGSSVLYLGPSSNFGGAVTATAPDIWAQGATYNSTATFTKTGGSSNHNNQNQNIFNSTCTINQQSSTGYLMLGYNSNDLFNDNITLTSTGTGGIYLGWGSGTGTPTLAAGKTILVGGVGFSAGFLSLNTFTQSGNAPMNLTFTGASTGLTFARNSVIGGNLTTSTPDVYFNGCTFNGTVNATKTGSAGDFGSGGNTFNGVCSITNSGASYLVLGNGNPDIWNTDVTFTDNGSERLLPCWASAGNQFNGNIYVNTAGSAQGIQFCGGSSTATATLAATMTIQAGATGLTAGYLYLKQFTQLGNASITLTATGSSVLFLGPYSNFGGAVTASAPDIFAQGATYNGAATFTKTGGGSNHNNQYQNIFNSTCTINQQSNTGYFMLGYNSNDLFNDNITITSTGSGGINLGYGSGTGTPTLAAGKTILVGAAGYSAGFLALNTFMQLGNAPINLLFTGSNTYLNFARSSVIGGNLTATVPDVYFSGCTFNGTVNVTKTGAGNDAGGGGNIFQGSTTLNNAGTGYLILGNGTADTWNSDVTFNSSGSSYIAPAWNSAGNMFNGNITVSSTGSSTGIQFCSNAASTATLSSGYTVQTGAAGFSSGTLLLRQFTQLGNVPNSLTLTGGTALLQVGPSSAFGGAFTAVSPRILLNGAVYSDTVNLTKTGATGEWSFGGNTFNAKLVVNQLGAGYFGFANGAPDIYNGDVYANNNSTERIIFGNNPVGNQFNGNIILTQIGSSVGIAFGWSATTNETLAAGKTISIGAAGFSTGYLQIERFTQLGNAPINLPLTGNSSLVFGPTSTIGGDLTSTSGSLYFNGCMFNGMVNSTKTGATSDWSSGNNIFNGVTTITNSGSGFLLFGNGNADQFNTVATFNNTGSNNIYVAYNSSNNIFGGVTTFNNSPTANTLIYVSSNSSGTVFNDNIVVTSTNGQGVQFCTGNATAAATLSAGKTITVGASGFSAGTLLLRQFTQTGATPQSLTLTGAGNLTFGPSSAFGGNTTTVSPTLFFNGCNFGGTVTSTKNGASNDGSLGNNSFGGAFSVTNTGTGYFLMGNGNPDLWQSTAVFNNLSAAQHMYIAYNSTGNIFNGDVTFNNQPGTTGLYIYPNQAGINTQFNGNINVVNVNGAGVYFGSGTGTATLASGGTIVVGAAGFNSGSLIFRNFTQAGSGTAQNITTTGTSNIQFNSNNTFAGPVTSSSPGLFFNGTTFNGLVNCTKTGPTNDNSQGSNIFNAPATFTANGTGYLLMTNNTPDAYNSDVKFVQTSTGRIYPNYNGNSTYAGNLMITSPAATAITFGSGTGTATLTGTGGQNISITAGTPTPVFTRLVINNTGSGVTLTNTSISVSNNLVLTSGLLNTTTSYLLTMLNGSTTAPGDATSTSYVNGPMQYQKSTAGVTTLNFPIGTSPDCRPFVLTVNHSNGTLYTYQAQLFNIGATLLNYALPPSITRVSQVHYWTIGRSSAGVNQPTAGLSGNQTIQLFFGSDDFVSDGSTLTVAKNVYTAPTNWIDIGGVGGPAYNAGASLTGSITSTSSPTAFNSFSTFTLANKIGGSNVLPIELLYFRAQPDNNRVDLQWATSTESNNSYFTIEKSKDGVSFDSLQKIATEAPNGNSSVELNYNTQDPNPYAGISYYRLKQTDLDGKQQYSAIVSVDFIKRQSLSIYPNPTRGSIYVTGVDPSETSLKAEWFDLSGKLLLQGTVSAQGGAAMLTTNFNNGVYLLRLISSDGTFTVHSVIVLK
jgi:hypothetical protein